MTGNRKTRAVVIGCGEMGGILLRSMAASGRYRIAAVDIDEKRRKDALNTGAEVFSDIRQAWPGEIYVAAVKPRDMNAVLKIIGSLDIKGRVFISVAAGVTVARIVSFISSMPVVRAMPNAPIAVGEGMTALSVAKGAPPEAVEEAVRLFSLSGEADVVDENIMDAVTSTAGSGPAYFFLLAARMKKFLTERGMNSALAAKFVSQTILGSGKLMAESGNTFEQLMASVASPGGTTEAALNCMKSENFTEIFYRSLEKAVERARELSKQET